MDKLRIMTVEEAIDEEDSENP